MLKVSSKSAGKVAVEQAPRADVTRVCLLPRACHVVSRALDDEGHAYRVLFKECGAQWRVFELQFVPHELYEKHTDEDTERMGCKLFAHVKQVMCARNYDGAFDQLACEKCAGESPAETMLHGTEFPAAPEMHVHEVCNVAHAARVRLRFRDMAARSSVCRWNVLVRETRQLVDLVLEIDEATGRVYVDGAL